MIRSENIRMNSGIRDTRRELTGMEEVIDSPARIVHSSIPHWRPPGIRSLKTRIFLAEDIYESHFEEFIETMAFLERESMFALILFPVLQINSFVSDIQISAKYNRLMGLELQKIIPHSTIPHLAIWEAREVVLGIWHIAIHVVEVLELKSNRTPFIICFCTNTIHHRKWWDSREHSSP